MKSYGFWVTSLLVNAFTVFIKLLSCARKATKVGKKYA